MIDFIEINTLFNIEKGSLQSTKCTEGQYDFITASSEWKTHNEYTHDQEALVVAVSASGSLGRVHYVKGKFISSDLCFILTPRSEEHPVDLSFYYYIFRSIRDDLVKSTATGTSKLAINKTNFGNYKLPYVDITKQKNFKSKLINVAERKEKLTESNEIQLNLIQTLRQQILQDAITGRLSEKWRKENPDVDSAEVLLEKIKDEKERLVKEGKFRKQKDLPPLNDNETPFELPDGWVWCRLGEISDNIHYGYTASALNTTLGVGLLRITDIQDNKVDWMNVPACDITQRDIEKFLLKEGDILIARTGGTIGKSFVVEDVTRKSVFASYLIRIIPPKSVSYQYLKYYLESSLYWKLLIIYSKGTGQMNVNATNLSTFNFPLPPLSEQHYIVEYIETLFTKLDRIKELSLENQTSIDLLNKVVLKEMFEE